MAIDVRGFRCLVAVASAGSISRAAESLHVAQPALSLHIKNIERDLGVALFDRTPKGVVPTAAGTRFLSHARDILKRIDLACEDVGDFVAEPAGRVAIGLPQSMAKILTLPLVRETTRRWPKIQLQIIELSTGYIPERLMTAHLDIGLVFQSDANDALQFEHLVDEELVLVAAPGLLTKARNGRLGRLKAIPFADLGRYPMILPASVHSLRSLIDRHLDSHRVVLNMLAEVNAIAQLIELAAAGVCCSILSYASVRDELRSGLLSGARIVEPGISRPVFLCRSATSPLSMAASTVRALVLSTVQSLIADGSWPACTTTRPRAVRAC